MNRLFALIIVALLVPASADAAKPKIEDAQLRYDIAVEGPVIMLSDLLIGSERAESIQVARAPSPGASLALNPVAIGRLAARYRIRWSAPIGLKRIVVRRASNVVDSALVQSEIEMALADIAPNEDLEVDFRGRATSLHVATDVEPTIAVESLDYDRRTGRFTALVSVPADDPTAERHRISGRAWRMVEVPVLSERLNPGSEIQEHHLSWQRMRADKVRRQTVTDAGELLGMSPKRTVAPNRPIRSNDLQRPVMIDKGDVVTMVFRAGGLTLTASGRAVESGGRNGVIRVLNERSRLTVEARIVAPGQVVVGEAMPRLSQLSQ